jgi:uncharacterized protein YunC (DUF1805 family)
LWQVVEISPIETKNIKIDEKNAVGLKVDLEGAPLLLIIAPKGYVMCGYLNLETAEKFRQAAAIVAGVKSFDDVLSAKIAKLTTKAKEIGIKEGMAGRDALKQMF